MVKGKTTHKIHDVEGMILERLEILQNSRTKEEKRQIRKEIINLEKHVKDINYRDMNEHKYPERMKGFPDDVPMNVPEVLKLIDSVDTPIYNQYVNDHYNHGLNLEGVSVGKNTFEYVDLGWPKAKDPKLGGLL